MQRGLAEAASFRRAGRAAVDFSGEKVLALFFLGYSGESGWSYWLSQDA
jgi:hypothetical protein